MRGRPPVRFAVVGDVDSGKSTLVGVLTKCILDNGNGLARQYVFNYPHEKENGRTSSIAQEIMGFDENLQQVQPGRLKAGKAEQCIQVAQASKKFLNFIDLCGHEKYLRTTIFGLTAMMPDYAMIVVGANMGVSRMTKEHLGITLALSIPCFIVVTKVDIAPADVAQKTLETLTKLLHGAHRSPQLVKEGDEMAPLVKLVQNASISPIFSVSNVTGTGLEQLKKFLGLINSRVLNNPIFRAPTEPAEFVIDGIYTIAGMGVVVAGTMISGAIIMNQVLLLGPDDVGEFSPVIVRSIEFNRIPAEKVVAGQAVSFGIKYHGAKKDPLKKHNVRKGMVLVDKTLNPRAAWEFDAEVIILQQATMIQEKYQPVIHCGVIQQSAEVAGMDHECMRAKDRGRITFRFMRRPEYLNKEATVLFREGNTKGIGKISAINYEYKPTKQVAPPQKKRKKKTAPPPAK